MRLLCLLLCLLVFGSGVPGQEWRSVLYGRGCVRYANIGLFFSPPAAAKRIRSFSGTPRTPALTVYHKFLFKDQKKNRQKGEWLDERLPARTGRRTSPATRFSSLVAHHPYAPGNRPGGQWYANTVGWSTGQPARGPDGPPPAPGLLAVPAGLADQ